MTSKQVHKNNLDKFYEYRIYDKNIGYSSEEYAPCPVVVMSRHQGFQWNDELFVSAYRRKAGYECHKSDSLKDREEHILQSTATVKDNDVLDIKLTEADCDVWP